MKCCLMWHFIRAFTDCQTFCLPVSGMKGLNRISRSFCRKFIYKSPQRLCPQILCEMTTHVFKILFVKNAQAGEPWPHFECGEKILGPGMECVDHHGSAQGSHDQVTLPPAADLWYPTREIIIILDG